MIEVAEMKLTYLTLFPQLIQPFLEEAFFKKAFDKKLIQFELVQLRDFSDNKYKSIDSSPFGGSDGMLIRPDVLEAALLANKKTNSHLRTKVVYLSPQGVSLNFDLLKKLLDEEHLILISGRYAGVDQRFIDHYVDEEVSIGDYVLNGGEIASLALSEALLRLIPGVLGDDLSALNDSFVDGFLEFPQYTQPSVWTDVEGHVQQVPPILLSGHHQKIQSWQDFMSLMVTWRKRPDLYARFGVKFILKILSRSSYSESQFFKLNVEIAQQNEFKNLICAGFNPTELFEFKLFLSGFIWDKQSDLLDLNIEKILKELK